MDITQQNRLMVETDKTLFNARVTNVSVSMDWLVTGEGWDDQEHSPHTRIKFWEFDKAKQV